MIGALSVPMGVYFPVVAASGPSRVVRTFDTRTGELDYSIEKHTDWVTALAYSPDGVLLADDRRVGIDPAE